MRTENDNNPIAADKDNIVMNVYPNPAREAAVVEFNIPTEGQVTIEIYNLVGQKVKTLYNDIATEGQTHVVKINSMDYEAGVYYVRLNTGSETISQKIVFIR